MYYLTEFGVREYCKIVSEKCEATYNNEMAVMVERTGSLGWGVARVFGATIARESAKYSRETTNKPSPFVPYMCTNTLCTVLLQ